MFTWPISLWRKAKSRQTWKLKLALSNKKVISVDQLFSGVYWYNNKFPQQFRKKCIAIEKRITNKIHVSQQNNTNSKTKWTTRIRSSYFDSSPTLTSCNKRWYLNTVLVNHLKWPCWSDCCSICCELMVAKAFIGSGWWEETTIRPLVA